MTGMLALYRKAWVKLCQTIIDQPLAQRRPPPEPTWTFEAAVVIGFFVAEGPDLEERKRWVPGKMVRFMRLGRLRTPRDARSTVGSFAMSFEVGMSAEKAM